MAQEIGMNLLDEKAYSKAKSQFQRMTRYDPENPGAWALLALSQKKMKAVRDAKESTEKFHEALKAVSDVDHLPLDQRKLLREGLVRTAEDYEKSGELDAARTTMDLGEAYFMENPEFNSLYRELEGSADK